MNIYVVEDEYWALMELEALMRRYETEHQIYCFGNGDDAYEAMKSIRPELVITDITMPGMDGLELVAKVKELSADIECVLLTVHDTFDYAKQGIHLGVADYLLKPINKDTLFETIDWILQVIEEKHSEREALQNWSLTQLLSNATEKENEQLALFDQQSFDMLYLLLGNWEASHSWSDIDDYTEEIKQLLGPDEVWFLPIDQRRKVILIPSQSAADKQIDIYRKIHSKLNQKCLVHIGYLFKTAEEKLRHAFDRLHRSMEQSILFGHASFVICDSVKKEVDVQALWNYVRLMENALSNGEFGSLKPIISKLMCEIEKKHLTQRQLVRLLWDMYYAISYKLENRLINEKTRIKDMEEKLAQMYTFLTFHEVEGLINQLVLYIAEDLKPLNLAPKHLIPIVEKWVKTDYAKNITFQQFADEHHVSLSYLSREFKEQTGVTFSEYLTQYRIKKAKEFLDSGLQRTAEVGEMVGYQDPKHFRTVFKKVTGITPTEYRRGDCKNRPLL